MPDIIFTPYPAGASTAQDYYVNFTNGSGPSLILRAYNPGDFINMVTVQVSVPFDPGFTITVGYPASPTAIVALGDVDLTTAGNYMFPAFRVSSIAETLTAYFAGVSVGGSGTIFVE